jgi:hypothetical protein
MRRRAAFAALLLPLLPGTGLAEAGFGRTVVYLERNATDGDAEVRFEVTGGKDGLAALQVTAPDGRTVLDLRTPDSKLGMRQFILESPEPRDNSRLRADFPAGPYRFLGTTSGGTTLRGTATLSHAFPPAPSIVSPRDGQTGLAVTGLRIEWRPVPGLAACIVTIEQEATGREIRADLAGSATAFVVPDGFLAPNTAYKFSIGTVSQEGNRSFVEAGFLTVGRK